MSKNLYLIGMMGSGKSATGSSLAKILQFEFVDMDSRIEEKNKTTISKIFEEKGEFYFRNLEEELLKELSDRKKTVFATGGGIVIRPGNIQRMKSSGTVIYLRTNMETIWNRVKAKAHRPLLKGDDPEAVLKAIFSERKKLYENTGDLVVDTDGKKPEEVAHEIAAMVKHS